MPPEESSLGTTKRQERKADQTTAITTFSSRRKACDLCVRGKRRCDGGKPCSRCSRRGLQCTLAQEFEAQPWHKSSTVNSSTLDESQDYSASDFDIDLGWLDAKKFVGTYQGLYNSLPPDATVQLKPSHLARLVGRLRSSIATMAYSGQTTFLKALHHAEEPIDAFLDEALLVCCSYVHRNKNTRASINNTIARKHTKLSQALGSHMNIKALLSALQAAILFEIMLLFDEDMSMQNLGEHHFVTIEAAMANLQQRLIEELVCPTSFPEDDPTSQYSQWLLLESIRRVIISHWIVKATYNHLRDGYCRLVPLLCTLPLTPRGDLWAATSEEEWWRKTQNERTHLAVVPYAEAVDFWNADQFSRMDEFQIMLFEACKDMPSVLSVT